MPRATPGDSRWQGKISLEGYTPAKMAARAASSLLQAASSLLRADSLLTARRAACLPPRRGKFTARGAVSDEPKENRENA